MLTASYLFAGYSDYFQGHSETNCEEYSEHLLYALYGRNTSLRDIIDELVEDSYNGPAGESLPDVSEDDVRAALLGMLNDVGRSDYESGTIAECSAAWMDCNPLSVCPDCGDYTPDGEGEEECPECGFVFDTDPYDDYESPIFVMVLRYEKGSE